MAGIEDEISFESDDHDPISNGGGAGATGSMSVTMSEENVRKKLAALVCPN